MQDSLARVTERRKPSAKRSGLRAQEVDGGGWGEGGRAKQLQKLFLTVSEYNYARVYTNNPVLII